MAASSRPQLSDDDYVYVVNNYHNVFLHTANDAFRRMFTDAELYVAVGYEGQPKKEAVQKQLESLEGEELAFQRVFGRMQEHAQSLAALYLKAASEFEDKKNKKASEETIAAITKQTKSYYDEIYNALNKALHSEPPLKFNGNPLTQADIKYIAQNFMFGVFKGLKLKKSPATELTRFICDHAGDADLKTSMINALIDPVKGLCTKDPTKAMDLMRAYGAEVFEAAIIQLQQTNPTMLNDYFIKKLDPGADTELYYAIKTGIKKAATIAPSSKASTTTTTANTGFSSSSSTSGMAFPTTSYTSTPEIMASISSTTQSSNRGRLNKYIAYLLYCYYVDNVAVLELEDQQLRNVIFKLIDRCEQSYSVVSYNEILKDLPDDKHKKMVQFYFEQTNENDIKYPAKKIIRSALDFMKGDKKAWGALNHFDQQMYDPNTKSKRWYIELQAAVLAFAKYRDALETSNDKPGLRKDLSDKLNKCGYIGACLNNVKIIPGETSEKFVGKAEQWFAQKLNSRAIFKITELAKLTAVDMERSFTNMAEVDAAIRRGNLKYAEELMEKGPVMSFSNPLKQSMTEPSSTATTSTLTATTASSVPVSSTVQPQPQPQPQSQITSTPSTMWKNPVKPAAAPAEKTVKAEKPEEKSDESKSQEKETKDFQTRPDKRKKK